MFDEAINKLTALAGRSLAVTRTHAHAHAPTYTLLHFIIFI